MKELIEPIQSDTPLAKAFNRVMAKMQLLRIMSLPRVFKDSKDEMAAFRMQNYYETVLWEKWLHGVLGRLEEWSKTISAYFDEFNGSWEYYALSKRLDFIREFGSDVPTIIASTASPYKFAPAVLGAIAEDKLSDDEFDMLSALNAVSGVETPAPLAGLKGKAVRFDRVCDGSDMKETVLDMLGIAE